MSRLRVEQKGADTLYKQTSETHAQGVRSQPSNITTTAKSNKNYSQKKKEKKMLMSLFIHEGSSWEKDGHGRGQHLIPSTRPQRPQRLIILSRLRPVPGQNGSSRSVPDCGLHICLARANV